MAKDQIDKSPQLILFGGSSGGLKVVMNILSSLRPGFNIPLLIVLHRNNSYESLLTDLLSLKSGLIVKELEEKESILPGHVYVAPADYHVLIEKNRTFSLDYSERVHYSRPSIDVIFKAAADVYGEKLICILLSGGNADGAEGLEYVKQLNGLAIVQDPDEAAADYMPRQALKRMEVDLVLDTKGICAFLDGLDQ